MQNNIKTQDFFKNIIQTPDKNKILTYFLITTNYQPKN